MFKELSPILATRGLVLTLSSVEEGRIRVTVTPRSTGKDDPKEVSQPFAVEGTAEELDAGLHQAISGYTAEIMTLSRSLALVKTNMEAALKEAKAEADKKVADAKKGSKPAPATKVEPAKPEIKQIETRGLFDAPEAQKAAIVEATAPTTAPVIAESVPAEVSEEEEAEEEEDASPTPVTVIHSAAAVKAATSGPQQGMFDTNEEDEILKEAFYGAQDNSVAA